MSEGFYLRIKQEHGPVNSKGAELTQMFTFFDTREGADPTETRKANESIAEALREYGPAVKVEVELIPTLVHTNEGEIHSYTDDSGVTHTTISAVAVTKGENA